MLIVHHQRPYSDISVSRPFISSPLLVLQSQTVTEGGGSNLSDSYRDSPGDTLRLNSSSPKAVFLHIEVPETPSELH